MKSYHFANVDEARKCLGIPAGIVVTRIEAKRCYARAINANHPDKVLWTDPKTKKKANKKTRKLLSAWKCFSASYPAYPIDFYNTSSDDEYSNSSDSESEEEDNTAPNQDIFFRGGTKADNKPPTDDTKWGTQADKAKRTDDTSQTEAGYTPNNGDTGTNEDEVDTTTHPDGNDHNGPTKPIILTKCGTQADKAKHTDDTSQTDDGDTPNEGDTGTNEDE